MLCPALLRSETRTRGPHLPRASSAAKEPRGLGGGDQQRCASQGDLPTLCPRGRDHWAPSELRALLSEFFAMYPRRPISRNFHGVSMNHAFALWFLAKTLEPKGAGPDAKIFSIDPRAPDLMQYKDSNPRTTYLTGDDFEDFGNIKWLEMLTAEERASTLVVLDDHMSAVKRVLQSLRFGFRHLWYDDNWKYAKVDCYSFNTLCSPATGGSVVYRDNFNSFVREISLREHQSNVDFLVAHVEAYFEFPPIWDSRNPHSPRSAPWHYLSRPVNKQGNATMRADLLGRDDLLARNLPGVPWLTANPDFFTYFSPYILLQQHNGTFDESAAEATTPKKLEREGAAVMRVSGLNVALQSKGKHLITSS
ncbi:hypothetical protein M885DRAFT_622816 [Pelagophyceae sp. CCMP2097]|nr:hypothetical protein M885DRAFT_622816 [Pelagophyceae sp. CCMP2097]